MSGMSIFVITFLMTINQFSYAGEFDNGSPEFDDKSIPSYSEADIQRRIQNEMEVACTKNLCNIVGSDNKGDSWTVSFNVGYGTQNNSNAGGSTVYVGTNSTNTDPGYNAGVTVTYKNYRCNSVLKVTPAVYRFVNTYLYNMVNADGSTKRNFSPADQTVILFYTTMLNKVEGCKGN